MAHDSLLSCSLGRWHTMLRKGPPSKDKTRTGTTRLELYVFEIWMWYLCNIVGTNVRCVCNREPAALYIYIYIMLNI